MSRVYCMHHPSVGFYELAISDSYIDIRFSDLCGLVITYDINSDRFMISLPKSLSYQMNRLGHMIDLVFYLDPLESYAVYDALLDLIEHLSKEGDVIDEW